MHKIALSISLLLIGCVICAQTTQPSISAGNEIPCNLAANNEALRNCGVVDGTTGASKPHGPQGPTGRTGVSGDPLGKAGPQVRTGPMPNWTGSVNGGALNASVNTQINVMATPYNARGDCLTDDREAIQTAVNAAWMYAVGNTSPAVVYFPKPPGGCYLTSTIQWNGASLEGQPSGIFGKSRSSGVVIKGKPGQDILHGPDPSKTAFNFTGSWSIHSIQFVLDDTVSTVGLFPHRFPGRWFSDAGMTAGSAVLYTHTAKVGCGDVGQAIEVDGAGPGGTNLVTTIQSVFPCWAFSDTTSTQVILATAASTTVSRAKAYVSVNGYPVTYTLGNAAIAFDNSDGNKSDWPRGAGSGTIYNKLADVMISSVSYTDKGQNGSVGIFTQGAWGMYGTDASFVNITRLNWAVAEVCSDVNSTYQSCANDYQTWRHMDINAQNPWISYNGLHNHLEDIQLAAGSGMDFLSQSTIYEGSPDDLNVSNVGWEGANSVYGFRYTGTSASFSHVSLSSYTGRGGPHSTAYIDGSELTCDKCSWTSLNLGGNHNRVYGGFDESASTVANVGRDNTILVAQLANPSDSLQPGAPYVLTPSRNPYRVTGTFVPDFLSDGNYSTAYNREDLLFWPSDAIFNTHGKPWSKYIGYDSASPSGQYFLITSSDNTFGGVAIDSANSGINTVIPATGVTLVAAFECVGGTAASFGVGGHSNRGGYDTISSRTIICSTSKYQTFSVHASLSRYSGGYVYFTSNSGSTNLKLAWVYFRPDVNNINDAVSGYAQLNSPAFTGTPTASTQSGCSSTTQIATSAYVAACGGGGAGLLQWVAPGVARSGSARWGNANTTKMFDFVLSESLSISKITYGISTPDDASNLYDIGIYSNSGTLLCHVGATAGTTFAPSTGLHTLPFTSKCSLRGGERYYLAITTNARSGSAAYYHTGNVMLANSGVGPSSGGTTTGGALNCSVVPAADAWTDTNGFPEISLHN